MVMNLNQVLKSKIINGWRLFFLITVPISLLMVVTMKDVDLSSPAGLSSMIQLSVRCSVPWLFVAFAASSFHVLFPGSFGRWLLRNRSKIGLCFATAMGWQLLFIVWLVSVHTQYYLEEVYVLSDAVEGVIGFILLIGMVLTSFKFGRSRLTPGQWKILHKTGIYWLWAYAWSVYWFNLYYYQSPVLLDYFYYWGGTLAWSMRMGAWSKKRWQQSPGQPLVLVPGIVMVLIGLAGIGFGSNWSAQAYELYAGIRIMEFIDTFMPYFPFVPFYPVALITFGAFLIVKSKALKTAGNLG